MIIQWTRDEVERLVAWMEGNQELLRVKQIARHKQVKEEVFANEGHITVKKINENAINMKEALMEGSKAMQERSGWGVRSEDSENSINEAQSTRLSSGSARSTGAWNLFGAKGQML